MVGRSTGLPQSSSFNFTALERAGRTGDIDYALTTLGITRDLIVSIKEQGNRVVHDDRSTLKIADVAELLEDPSDSGAEMQEKAAFLAALDSLGMVRADGIVDYTMPFLLS